MYQDSFDVVKLVRYGRALRTVLRLFLSSKDRQLLRIQRRNSVIEAKLSQNAKSTGDDILDEEIIQKVRKKKELS